MESRKGQWVRVDVAVHSPVAAAHKGRVTKRVTATVRTGVDYANLAVNADRETGSLPWGEWAVFPWVIVHKARSTRASPTASARRWASTGSRHARAGPGPLHPQRVPVRSQRGALTAFTVALEASAPSAASPYSPPDSLASPRAYGVRGIGEPRMFTVS